MDAHDPDLEHRQRELAELDAATKRLTVCGVAFLNDAYDMFAINIVAMIMGFNTVPQKWDTLIKIAVQLVMGRLGDKIGRTTVYAASLMIAIFTTIASAFSNSMVKGMNVFCVLFIWRVLLGFGIGGDYPITATIVSEYANVHNRGKLMAAVFAFQGFGNVLAPIVSGKIDEDVENLDYVWRLIIGLGCIPGESARFQKQAQEDTNAIETAVPVASRPAGHVGGQRRIKTFKMYFGEWRHLKVLLGTSIAWFALDVAFYGINLNSSVVIDAIGFAGDMDKDTPSHYLTRNCVGNIIINMLGSVPGYWVSVFTIERLGRKKIQILGFVMLTILYVILGFAYNRLLDNSSVAFIVLFAFAQFFQNFGPNVTSFVIPGEVFPTRFRATAHGISAAAGKLGAIVAQGGFLQLKDIGGKNATLEEICDESEEYY
ncbi:MFS general substrate transporter [Linderina pennispora]|uniref:MFS general substrate transporter n=1 Tax=Linderina pennispora TaxID=61395 RepID=A0A1Y1WEC6_9FUNG|nr:MFS general substrate transporter [Linderina pennispora]ORX71881.1 MFS general substrate transporter [Linderina pennispora]